MSAAAVARVLERLEGVRRTGNGWTGRCPAHTDKAPSLSVNEGRGGVVLVHCFAGCPTAEVLAAIGLNLRDLFPEGRRRR